MQPVERYISARGLDASLQSCNANLSKSSQIHAHHRRWNGLKALQQEWEATLLQRLKRLMTHHGHRFSRNFVLNLGALYMSTSQPGVDCSSSKDASKILVVILKTQVRDKPTDENYTHLLKQAWKTLQARSHHLKDAKSLSMMGYPLHLCLQESKTFSSSGDNLCMFVFGLLAWSQALKGCVHNVETVKGSPSRRRTKHALLCTSHHFRMNSAFTKAYAALPFTSGTLWA